MTDSSLPLMTAADELSRFAGFDDCCEAYHRNPDLNGPCIDSVQQSSPLSVGAASRG